MVQLRPGELAGLRWDDIDWKRSTISIKRTRTLDETGHEILGDTPKTPNSEATLGIPPSCLDSLRRHKAQQAEQRLRYPGAWHDLGLVFTSRDGSLLNSKTIADRLKRLCRAADVPEIPPHRLRHLGASWMLLEGEDLKTISERLRHASIAITSDLYIHLLDDAQHDASIRLDAALARHQNARLDRVSGDA